MIKNPLAIVAALLFIESVVLFLAHDKRVKGYFDLIPSVFWIYFLPMMAATFGLLDSRSPVYEIITTYLLPASLFLLLIPVEMKAILRLGKPALLMMLAGSVGIMLGTVISIVIFAPMIGREFWSGFGALSASWMGGSANMIAVKEAVGTPDRVFLPMVIVDTVVPYCWMGLLVVMVSQQKNFDRFTRANQRIIADLRQKKNYAPKAGGSPLTLEAAVILMAIALAGSLLAQGLARHLPEIKNILSTYAWTIIAVSILGVALSYTPARHLEKIGASRVGYFLLYFVLTSIGAKASLVNLYSTIMLILAGWMIVAVHAVVLVLTARFLRAPLFLVAVASQANIGGVASAPMVAEIYLPGFASVGLLLAILGNILGTYFGIVTAQLCWLASG